MSKRIIIAIDGFSSCGKSTMAKALARELNYIFIDSGAMYRTITYWFLKNKIDIDQLAIVDQKMKEIQFDIKFNPNTKLQDIYLDGEMVNDYLSSLSVAEKVSQIAAIESVRTYAVNKQQELGKLKGIVMDGRDIGTTVFPEAELKIFVTASIEERAKRRYDELLDQYPEITLDEVKRNLEAREYADQNRSISPLKKASDARILDTSLLSKEDQLAIVYQWAQEVIESE